MSVRHRTACEQPLLEPVAGPVDFHALHRLNPDRYPFLVESTAASESLGRYDVLFAFPGKSLVLDEPGSLSGELSDGGTEFLVALDSAWREERCDSIECGLPFSGGWFLYLGHELAAEV